MLRTFEPRIFNRVINRVPFTISSTRTCRYASKSIREKIKTAASYHSRSPKAKVKILEQFSKWHKAKERSWPDTHAIRCHLYFLVDRNGHRSALLAWRNIVIMVLVFLSGRRQTLVRTKDRHDGFCGFADERFAGPRIFEPRWTLVSLRDLAFHTVPDWRKRRKGQLDASAGKLLPPTYANCESNRCLARGQPVAQEFFGKSIKLMCLSERRKKAISIFFLFSF